MELQAKESCGNCSIAEELGDDYFPYNIFNIWSSTFAFVEPELKSSIAIGSQVHDQEDNHEPDCNCFTTIYHPHVIDLFTQILNERIKLVKLGWEQEMNNWYL